MLAGPMGIENKPGTPKTLATAHIRATNAISLEVNF
jgi:hypothetical protein